MPDTKKLIIPERIKVGFNERGDTYTGKLAFVIRQGEKGEWKSEKSWESWRNKEIDVIEAENVPTEGFVLNKGVGGVRQSYGWNTRNEYVRVYDPRGWEFEISVPNLLFVLQESVCHPGKGLEGQFVYAWPPGQGKVMLLPCSSYDYKVSKEFTQLQDQKVSARDLVRGATYTTKDNRELVYIGYHVRYRACGPRHNSRMSADSAKSAKQKRHIFWNSGHPYKNERWYKPLDAFEPLSSMAKIAVCSNENPANNFAELDQLWYESPWGTPIKELVLMDAPKPKQHPSRGHHQSDLYAYFEKGRFYRYRLVSKEYWEDQQNKRTPEFMCFDSTGIELKDGILTAFDNGGGYGISAYSYPPDFPEKLREDKRYWHSYNQHSYYPTILPWNPRKKQILVAVLESGVKYTVGYSGLEEERIK